MDRGMFVASDWIRTLYLCECLATMCPLKMYIRKTIEMHEEKDPRHGNGRVYCYAPCRASNLPGIVQNRKRSAWAVD